jgi:hypothetical protein
MLALQPDPGNIAVGVVMALACEHVKPGRLYFAIGLGAFVAVDKQVFAIAIEKIENPPVFYIADVITDDLQAPPSSRAKGRVFCRRGNCSKWQIIHTFYSVPSAPGEGSLACSMHR